MLQLKEVCEVKPGFPAGFFLLPQACSSFRCPAAWKDSLQPLWFPLGTGERWMLSVPQKRKRYPLPTGKEQVLALTAGEKLFTHSAGERIGNPSPAPCLALPAVPAAAQVLEGAWRCVSQMGWEAPWDGVSRVRNLSVSQLNKEGSRGQLRALREAAGREGGSELTAPVPSASTMGNSVCNRKRKRREQV